MKFTDFELCFSRKLLCMACSLAIGMLSFSAQAESAFSFASTPGKLPKDVIPVQYKLHLMPDIGHHTLRGEESIEIEVLQATDQIVLNALDIKIEHASVSGKDVSLQNLTPTVDKQQQTLGFKLAHSLAPGRYTLNMVYSGLINREPQGLYYDKYKVGKQEKQLIGTQMEATDARRMMPCWDEPVFRASFQMTVDIPTNFSAYSNTPITAHKALSKTLQRIEFAPTPKMASYLIVLVAGELERIARTANAVETGVVTVQGKRAQGKYALDAGVDLLAYYNDYFGQTFPLPKLDHIGVPGGFEGAMENWGGIVYNESNLLLDPKTATQDTQHRVFATVGHEMAHQWFGDLVTMAWWDNLWLNEGFATWMESKATDHFHQDWNVYLAEREGVEYAMRLDAGKASHPIHQAVASEAQANDAFDAITYQKTGAFLRMLESYLGPDVFRTGIRNYMAKHKYSNTTSVDLWSELDQASGQPVSKVARDWTEMAGFPLVKVEAQCQNGVRSITLSQEPYTANRADIGDALWSIPVQIGTVDGKPDYVLVQEKGVTVTRSGCERPLLLDQDGLGFYRVQYSPELHAALAADFSNLRESSRVKLLSDTWALAASDRVPLERYLSLLNQIDKDDSRFVWGSVLDAADTLDRFAQGTPLSASWRKFMRTKLSDKFSLLGWENVPDEGVERRQLRAELLSALGKMDDEAVIQEAKKRFTDIINNKSHLSNEMDQAVIQTVGRNAEASTYQTLWKVAQTTTSAQRKEQFVYAMFAARDPALAEKSAKMSLDANLPPLLTSHVLQALANSDHLEMSWDFAMKHADRLTKMQPAYTINRFYADILGFASDTKYADQLESFAKEYLPEALNEARRTAESIRVRAAQKKTLLPQLPQYLDHSK